MEFEGTMKGRPTIEREEFKCYMIWQMMVAMLYSNGQLRTDRTMDVKLNKKLS